MHKQMINEDNKSIRIKTWWECLYMALESSISEGKFGNASFLVYFYYFLKKNTKDNYNVLNYTFITIPQWTFIIDRLSDILYSDNIPELQNSKRDLVQACDNLMKSLCDVSHNIFSQDNQNNYADITSNANDYLTEYIKLNTLIAGISIGQQEILVKDSVRLSLMTGYEYKDSDYLYHFFSPLIIENCLLIGNIIEQYRLEIEKSESIFSKNIQKEIYVSLIEEKIERLFSINTIINKSVYINSIDKKRNAKNSYYCEKIENKSCVETIEMVRLIEKIDSYMIERNRLLKSQENKPLFNTTVRILLIAHVDLNDKHGLPELCTFLKKKYECEFQFNIYYNLRDARNSINKQVTQGQWEDILEAPLKKCELKNEHESQTSICFFKDDTERIVDKEITMYMNRAAMNYFLSEDNSKYRFDMIFVLDSSAMYRNSVDIKADNSLEVYKEWLSNTAQRQYVSEVPKDFKNIKFYPIPNLPIKRIMTRYNMTALGLMDKEGHFEYKLREEIIKMFINSIRIARSSKKLRHIHVMISSSNSVNNTHYAKWNLVREEHYRGKSFCLFTFKSPTNQMGRLDVCKEGKEENGKLNKKFICFSLWNLYKHIDLNWLTNSQSKTKQILLAPSNPRPKSPDLINRAKSIYIFLGWNYDCIKKTVNYDIKWLNNYDEKHDAKKEKRADDLMNLFLQTLFFETLNYNDKALSLCFRNALMNAMYSRIRCLEDAVNYQMMKIHFEDEYETTVSINKAYNSSYISDLDIDVKNEINIINSVPSVLLPERWAIIKALKTLSAPMSEMNYYYMLHELQNINKIDANKLFENIMAICSESGYQGSILYTQAKAAWKNL